MKRLVGYAAHNTTLGTGASRTVRLRNATPGRLLELADANLASLRRILEWNVEHAIRLYRVSSNLIPYASHPVGALNWADELKDRFDDLASFINRNALILSVHPGQYTLLSSADRDVSVRSIAEIEYHRLMLDLLGTNVEARIIVHLGGSYGDKSAAVDRWRSAWSRLSEGARFRMSIENDERIYTVGDCFSVHRMTGVPVIFDNLHDRLNPGDSGYWRGRLERALSTWPSGVTPEVHYSDQAPGEKPGRHAETVDTRSFARFWEETADLDFNVTLETKDKEKSVLKVYRALGL